MSNVEDVFGDFMIVVRYVLVVQETRTLVLVILVARSSSERKRRAQHKTTDFIFMESQVMEAETATHELHIILVSIRM